LKNNAIIFIITNIVLVLNFLNYFGGDISLFYISYITFSLIIVYSIVLNHTKLSTITGIYFFILLLTLVPIIQIVFGIREYLMGGNSIRFNLHTDVNIHKTFFIILFQMATVASFLFLTKHMNYVNSNVIEFNKLRWSIGIIILSILSNPSNMITTHQYGAEDFGSAGGSFLIAGWSSILVIVYAYYAFKTQLRTNYDVILSFIIIIFGLLHGNRSEVFGIVILLFVFKYSSNLNLKTKLFWFFTIFILGAIFQIIGIVRGLESDKLMVLFNILDGDFSFLADTTTGIHISTVDAIDYSLMSIISIVDNGEIDYHYGLSIFDYLKRTLPGGIPVPYDRPQDFGAIVADMTTARGGVHFAGEAYWNGSILGVYIYTLFVMFLVLFFNNNFNTTSLIGTFALVLIMISPRVLWYGNIYLYKPMLVFIIFYIFTKIRFKRKLSNEYPSN
jgi:hypothetical protein